VIGSSLLPDIGYEKPIASIPDRTFGTGNTYIFDNEITLLHKYQSNPIYDN
jgi:hypothetical protein